VHSHGARLPPAFIATESLRSAAGAFDIELPRPEGTELDARSDAVGRIATRGRLARDGV
jgi:hypothetical protein